jgi:hypothetical protein
MEYLVWSIKMNAWFANGIYVSALNDAKRFPDREAAVTFCKGRYSATTGLLAVPVALADIEEVVRK